MKKTLACIVFASVIAIAGSVSADTLTVNATAAMNGTNFGLVVNHDNTSGAYVMDDTPAAENVYRAEFLFNPNSIAPSPTPKNMRQMIFTAHGNNPDPGNHSCPNTTFITPFRLFLYINCQNCPSQQYWVKGYVRGNWCGEAGVDQVQIPADQPSKICVEWENGLPGRIALAAVAENASCPSSGDPAWAERTYNNSLMAVDFVRMGTPETNNFAAGEVGAMYFDEFASFRTLAP